MAPSYHATATDRQALARVASLVWLWCRSVRAWHQERREEDERHEAEERAQREWEQEQAPGAER